MSHASTMRLSAAAAALVLLAALSGCSAIMELIDQPPVASIGVTPSSGNVVGQTVTLDASGSHDPQGYALSCLWSLHGPTGSQAALNVNNQSTVTFTPDLQGQYLASLVVRARGKSDSTSSTIMVGPAPTQYQLTVQSDGHGSVAPSGTSTVSPGAATSIAAAPYTGYAFSSWTVITGAGVTFANASSASTTVTLSGGNATIQANFTQTTQGGYTGNFLSWTGSSDSSHYFTLVRVNGQNGSVSDIGGSDYFPAMAYAPDGTLYGVASDLHIIDPASGATAAVGNLMYQSASILMCGAAFSPSGTLYVLENASPRRAFTVNLSNAALTYVGTLAVTARGLAFSSGGTLYAAFSSLYTLNPADMATLTTVGSIGAYVTPLTFGANGTLYATENFPSTYVYSLNLSTGSGTQVVAVGSGGLSSLVAERSASASSQASIRKAAAVLGVAAPPSVEALLERERAVQAAATRGRGTR